MKVLVVGAGAREHALAHKIAASERVEAVYAAPGNAGTARVGTNLDVAADDVPGIVRVARELGVGLVVVGPEGPLVAGVVDALRAVGIPTFGPTRAAARLEGSKAFSKDFMKHHGIPTAAYGVFDDAEAAKAWVRELGRPMVVKADGLAAGKGVVVAATVEESLAAIDAIMLERAHGDAGRRVVVEERLEGPEISFHVVCDGTRAIPLAAAQDHKRLLDGDEGPNTGGMGAYSPPPMVDPTLEGSIMDRVVLPTLEGMAEDDCPFTGVLFVGLMLVDGQPRVLEYNVRFGDPETEVLMARLASDVVPLLLGSARGDLEGVELTWGAPAALCVVMASEGYPGSYPKGRPIHGIEAANALPGVSVFEAGTRAEGDATVTSGGRVLCVTASGGDVHEAAERAYAGVRAIDFEGAHHRGDIGWQAR
ncbi:MAG: phosphoribosylamine--glycine ligase [Sandaracinaceae bacterium]|nr:phosphoribosylamine--glycine ligase [Sandaracinaceae bacterium]